MFRLFLKFHLGQGCSGVAESTFASMGVRRDKWRCKLCRTPPSSQPDSENAAALLSDIAEKLSMLETIKTQVKSISSLELKLDELLTLKPEVEKLKEVVGCVLSQASIILRLQSDLNDTEQYNGSSNLEIHGLPTSPDENLGVFLSDLSQKLKIPSFSPNQVSAIHRLPKLKSGPATALVRFTSKDVRGRWLAARSKLRDLTNISYQTLYISRRTLPDQTGSFSLLRVQ
ncbi:hypothetical protein HPB48_005758 [Haemaphysalis longicornis]|uniref:Uncharacterized protein n=1 Tax=Haemaphysalis longicornis TaxID=44386 RepID=A0A9J6GYN9_HAELO|nr:hypothetical protein HPB48_005758 [Haemaphysalis longicornis]